jgi:hypothetical protein
MKKRGRPTTLNDALTRRIIAYLRQGVDQKTACNLAGVPYSCFNEWKQKGSEGVEPFATFFSVISRARDRHKSRLLKIVLDAAEGLLPRHADWKAASWLLEKGWPLEYGDRRPLPIPPAEQAAIRVSFPTTLPSGNVADASEMMAIARELTEKWRESEQPKQPENEPPMEHWYNPATRRVEPRELTDNGAGED